MVGGNDLKKVEMREVDRPFTLSYDVDLKLSKYVVRMQELDLGQTVFQVRNLAHNFTQKNKTADRRNLVKRDAGKRKMIQTFS